MTIDLEAVRSAGRAAAQKPADGLVRSSGVITRSSFAPALLAAFDQSLVGCSMVVVDSRGVDIDIMRVRSFKTDPRGLEGYEGYLERAAQLEDQLAEEFDRLVGSFPGIEVVHETTPMGKGKFVNPEPSLLGAREVRRAARHHACVIHLPVSPLTHKTLVTGARDAKKAEVRELLPGFAASVGVTGYNLIRNEDQRDSLCIALAHLHRRGAA